MIPRGQFDRLITFQRATITRAAVGTKLETWPGATLGTAWAKVLYGTGSERRQAGVEGASQPATFRVLANDLTRGVIAKDRIVHDSLNWDITAIAFPTRHEIEFTAVATRG